MTRRKGSVALNQDTCCCSLPSFRSFVSRNEFVKRIYEAKEHDTEHIRDLFVTGKAVDEAAGCAIAELT